MNLNRSQTQIYKPLLETQHLHLNNICNNYYVPFHEQIKKSQGSLLLGIQFIKAKFKYAQEEKLQGHENQSILEANYSNYQN